MCDIEVLLPWRSAKLYHVPSKRILSARKDGKLGQKCECRGAEIPQRKDELGGATRF